MPTRLNYPWRARGCGAGLPEGGDVAALERRPLHPRHHRPRRPQQPHNLSPPPCPRLGANAPVCRAGTDPMQEPRLTWTAGRGGVSDSPHDRHLRRACQKPPRQTDHGRSRQLAGGGARKPRGP